MDTQFLLFWMPVEFTLFVIYFGLVFPWALEGVIHLKRDLASILCLAVVFSVGNLTALNITRAIAIAWLPYEFSDLSGLLLLAVVHTIFSTAQFMLVAGVAPETLSTQEPVVPYFFGFTCMIFSVAGVIAAIPVMVVLALVELLHGFLDFFAGF